MVSSQTKKPPKGIYVRLSEDLYSILRDAAEFEDRSMAGQIRHLLRDHLEVEL